MWGVTVIKGFAHNPQPIWRLEWGHSFMGCMCISDPVDFSLGTKIYSTVVSFSHDYLT